MKRIYMDHAATTAARPEVLEAMLPYFSTEFGNPSSVYGWGRSARKALDGAQDQVAALLGASASEDRVLLLGVQKEPTWPLKEWPGRIRTGGKHIITSAIGHHAVLDTVLWLETQGFEVTILPVDEYGLVSPSQVEQALRPDTILVSIMHANNEVGTIQPISGIGAIVRRHGARFHTGAVADSGCSGVERGRAQRGSAFHFRPQVLWPQGRGCAVRTEGSALEAPSSTAAARRKGAGRAQRILPGS